MSPAVKVAIPCHDEHDDINYHAREYVKAVKARDCEKEITEIGC